MNIIINQFQGLGDILFCIPIARELLNNGNQNIIWPVNPIYLNIQKHFPDIQFVNKETFKMDYNRKDIYELNSCTVIPMRFSDSIMKVPYYDCMRSKYTMVGLDMDVWRTLTFKRDHANETALFKKLGLRPGVKYTLVNECFRTGSSGRVDIQTNNAKVVKMSTIEGFTLLDWSLVIEHASEIHTVGTSINYLIEILKPKAKAIHLYIRKPDEKDFKNYDYILSKDIPYIFHN